MKKSFAILVLAGLIYFFTSVKAYPVPSDQTDFNIAYWDGCSSDCGSKGFWTCFVVIGDED